MDYNEANVAKAQNYADQMEADLGGTEILSPMQYVYQRPFNLKGQRFIILLTDGEVSNTDQVIETAQDNANTTRVFSVGMGEGASSALVNGVARVSYGISEFVKNSGDQLTSKVVALLKSTTFPSSRNISISWSVEGGAVAMTIPKQVPFAAQRGHSISQFAVITRIPGVWERPELLTIQGVASFKQTLTRLGSVMSRVPFVIANGHFSSDTDPLPLHRLAAKARLTELLDEYNISEDQKLKDESIELSIATGVLSKFTSLVAVDDSPAFRSENFSSPLFVSVERPTEYIRNENAYGSSNYNSYFFSRSFNYQSAVPFIGALRLFTPPTPVTQLDEYEYYDYYEYYETEGESNVFPPSTPQATLENIVRLQSFTGNWHLDERLVDAIGASNISDVSMLKNVITVVVGSQTDETIATLAAMATLITKYGDEKSEWELLSIKSSNYLKAQVNFQSQWSNLDIILANIAQALGL